MDLRANAEKLSYYNHSQKALIWLNESKYIDQPFEYSAQGNSGAHFRIKNGGFQTYYIWVGIEDEFDGKIQWTQEETQQTWRLAKMWCEVLESRQLYLNEKRDREMHPEI